jgi:hypothetical protein
MPAQCDPQGEHPSSQAGPAFLPLFPLAISLRLFQQIRARYIVRTVRRKAGAPRARLAPAQGRIAGHISVKAGQEAA